VKGPMPYTMALPVDPEAGLLQVNVTWTVQ